MNEEHKPGRTRLGKWLRGLGIAGFLFFLGKGLLWIAIFAGLIKGC